MAVPSIIFCLAAGLSAYKICHLLTETSPKHSSTTEQEKFSKWHVRLIIFSSGALCWPICKAIFKIISLAIHRSKSTMAQSGGTDSQIYGLEHGILNIEPPKTMWMNMGYWKGQIPPSDFPLACRSLLEEVLKLSGITDPPVSSTLQPRDRDRVNIIDLGFGCGDQTIYLAQMVWLASYMGITKDRKQFDFARKRLSALGILQTTPQRKPENPVKNVEIFCADAAQPKYWSSKIRHTMTAPIDSSVKDKKEETWVLALDVLYHFSPSRQAIFNHSFRELHASIMAYDLLLPEKADMTSRLPSLLQRLLLFVVSLLTSTPYSNFLTPEQYYAQLEMAGYAADDVHIHDMSEHVFAPLVRFLEERDAQLRMMGKGIGVFHIAKWIFGWWARSGVVRGSIVIARQKREVVTS